MNSIWQRKIDIDRRQRDERSELLKEHNEKFRKERVALIEECGKIGHVEGNLHDNGLGFTWFYCANCGGRMGEKRYSILRDEDE